MIEKTFVDTPLDSKDTTGVRNAERAAIRNRELDKKRIRVSGYIAASLNIPVLDVEIVEGLDIWESKKGRYFGVVEAAGKTFDFVSQSYSHKENQIITQVSISEQ
jgi:hypothetical protein